MSDARNIEKKLADLLPAIVDASQSDEDLTFLRAALESSSSARDAYVDYMMLDNLLEYEHSMHAHAEDNLVEFERLLHEESMREEDGVEPLRRAKSWLDRASRQPLGPAISVAIAVMIAMIVIMAVTPVQDWIAGGSDNEPQERAPVESEFVARLTNWQNDEWLEDTRPPLDEPRLREGKRLVLKSGFAEITYNTGARIVLEGPAEFIVGRMKDEGGRMKREGDESEGQPSSFIPHPLNSGFLRFGSLVARIENKEAKGFAIDTPTARVEDYGTEFGVEVRKSGATEVVVITGEVDVANEPTDSPPQRVRLTKDQGAFVATRGGAIKWSKEASAEFTLAMKSRLAVMRVTLDVDPRNPDRLVAYWPLKDGPAGSKVLGADDVVDDPTHPATDAKVSGKGGTWVADPERGIVLSTTKNDHLDAGTQGISRDFTWSLWIKTKEVSQRVVMGNRGGGSGGLQGGGNAAFNKLMTSGMGGLATISNQDADLGVADGQWHHIAIRRTNSAVNVFVDGNPVGNTAIVEGRFNGPLRIGGDDIFAERVTAFMSDVAIWDKALSIERIEGLAAGDPVVLGDEGPEGARGREHKTTNESKSKKVK